MYRPASLFAAWTVATCTIAIWTLTLAGIGLMTTPDPARADDLSAIEWTTNMDDPPIGDPNAKKGGTFRTYQRAYPLTLRLVGPDATDVFANWSQSYSIEFRLVRRHPTTDNYIPWMATHWSVQPDGRTVYYKLDPDARWTDGEKITADDYAFAFEMLSSTEIVDPFWNTRMQIYESVEAIEPYVLKVVGKKESWRPLHEFRFFPMPKHAINLGPNWIKEAHLTPPVVPGPYVVSETREGEYVKLSRVADWWGTNKRYMQGLYNVDHIIIRTIESDDRAFDFFKKGELDFMRILTAKTWAEDTNFDSIQKGWVHKKRVFVDYPDGLYGFAMNLEKPLFQNKDFRKALQYAFNFEEVNDNLMFGAYYRAVSTFEGSFFENPNLEPYGFDPKKVREHLAAAGFEKRGSDGIFTRDDGTRASFTLTFGSPGLRRHMTVAQQTMKRLGLEMKLQLLESGTAFKRGQERAYDVYIISQTTDFFPDPHQYFHSSFVATKNNNNVFAFGNARADELIETYRFGSDPAEREAAMHELDALIQDEAFYVPFWNAPFQRFLHWDHVRFPEFYLPKRTESTMQWQVFWIDEERQEALAAARSAGRALPKDDVVDVDPYGVKVAIEAALAGQ